MSVSQSFLFYEINFPIQHGVGLWKHIRKDWDQFSQFTMFEVGDGSAIRFWTDFWSGSGPLKQTFPELFRLARNKEAYIGDYMVHHNGSIHWDLDFTRSVQDWELESVSTFLDLLYSTKVQGSGADTLLWSTSGKKDFSVSNYYRVLLPSLAVGFPWKAIWKPKAPSRVAFFLWTTSLGKILTVDNLRKRNIILVSWCCMCKKDGETIDHLFLHCSLAYDLWSFVFSLFGVHWVMPRKVLDLLSCWQGSFRREQNSEIWAVIPHCLMWCLWRERNSRIFEDGERSILDLRLQFLRTLFDWMSASRLFSFHTFLDFLDHCHFRT